MVSRGNADKSANILGWQARNKMRDVVRLMIAEHHKS
jgi:GDP-D-mannose dehydratase